MQGVDHYENFPVASWWCPPALRAPIAAIYHFARTADDIVWRRTKLGLRMTAEEIAALGAWMATAPGGAVNPAAE